MIFCIFGGGKCRPRWGVQRGLPLALLGNFQRYVVLRLGKFPNKLRYFLRKYPEACLRSVRCISVLRFVPTVANVPKCACHSPVRSNPTSPIIFSLSVGGWRGGRFRFQRLFCRGRSGTRFSRSIRSQRSERKIYRETAQPPDLLADIKPRACFAFVNGNDCPALAGAEPPAIRAGQQRSLSPFNYCRFYFSDF